MLVDLHKQRVNIKFALLHKVEIRLFNIRLYHPSAPTQKRNNNV